MLTVLRNVTYRRLFAAQIVALIGTGLLTVALGLLAYDLAGRNAGAVLGTALTIKMLAYVGLAPVINALVARLPKKPVLIGADLIRAGMALSLPFITDTWQIYVVIFLLQSASATFTPAFQSLIPTILKDERDYTRALSLSRLAYDMEALASPALAALLLTLISYNNLFLGTVAGFLFSAVMVTITALPRRSGPTGPQASLWHRTTLGARIFWRNRRLRSLLALNLVVAAPTALVLVNTVVYVRDVLHRPDTDLALALACFGIGSMIVALSAPRVLDRFGDRAVMLTGAALIPAVLAGATLITFLGVGGAGWWLLLGLWFLLGAANSTILTPSSRLLRDASNEETRPYVFTAQFSLSHACYILTYPLAGWIGAAAGLGWAALVLTFIAMIGSAGAFLSWRRHTAATSQEPATEEQTLEQQARQRVEP
ncbi:MFS transporter (plasmid) [Arthrobacter sp. TES]|uniref:MFS transporter n=1 Tax=Paenarthrobacter ureafaciens TaxID=37931 RepID=UPI000397C9CF|nr:MFS transporter [Paenarthrobacter ureafaciens]AOY74146.1 major facilitator transporter [Arthrobacter sp. ZXY-2]ERI38010.1 major facilitator transporter [Arthrobacter sp. AK-YN10]QOI65777.1 MFS transporter [Arthrobacter sp. TES]GLU61096.1 MFS transporter [Paenarthrobacter ureafaciens]GLU65365.1 MFS transporter [Paenarthrobacter ureafaciens]